MTTELWDVVSGWKYPKEEMVAYRSFKPFFPLLDVHQVLSTQRILRDVRRRGDMSSSLNNPNNRFWRESDQWAEKR